ncbi:MAG: amino acid ABC transporter substrate-binding protein [Armatimonadota bacterium]|nr:amino acid ABC transporter substrate-binding protein [Armatimonadota bacterium]MDR5697388.1 amino acid ABC transporter substrate-binding protein [Armatimonadota bacterium]
MNVRVRSFAPLAVALALLAAACAPQRAQEQQPAASRLDTVLQRGRLICGVNRALPGWGFLDEAGNYSGFDVDFCRALAAALFDDPNAVEYRPLTPAERFTALQTGEADVLFRNTTWTMSRDTTVGMTFGPTTFYDGQGMMVRRASGIRRLEDFQGRSVCVQTGTTTELNLADQMRKRNVNYQPVVFDEPDPTFAAYEEGRCDGVTTDISGLVSRRTVMRNPADHVILDVVMSKEPLGPVVVQGDVRWFNVVKWVTFATFQAEEFGITSQNVERIARESQDPDIRRFLGVEGDLGQGMGVANDFAVRIIKHVGNYAEIYDRNLGPNTPFNLPRGLNRLWTEGGLLYSPPFR